MSKRTRSPEPGDVDYSNEKFLFQGGISLATPEEIIDEAASKARVECGVFHFPGDYGEYFKIEKYHSPLPFSGLGGCIDIYLNEKPIFTVVHKPSEKQIVLIDHNKRTPTILATSSVSEPIDQNSDDHKNTVNALKALIMKYVKSKAKVMLRKRKP